MWTANIESKDLEKGVFRIGVSYTNGQDMFTESYTIGSSADVGARVGARLNQLEELSAMDIPLGKYTASSPFIPPVALPDEKQEAINELRRIKDLVSLGVVDEEDKQVTDAVQAVKELL